MSPPLSAPTLWLELQQVPPPWLAALHTHNAHLWALEDRVRDRALPSAEVAEIKREIDRTNLARHGAVAQIDAALDARFAPRATLATPGVVLNSESAGQMLDRLSILALKRAAWAQDPARVAGIEARAALLVRCLDRTFAALAEGQALPQTFDEAKTYGA